MNYVANQLILKIISVQKFKDFLKTVFKQGFVHLQKIWGNTHIAQYIHQHKQSFQFQHLNFFHCDNTFFQVNKGEDYNVSQTKFNIV